MRLVQRPDLAGRVRDTDARRHPVRKIIVHRNTLADDPDGLYHEMVEVRGWRLFPYHLFVDEDAVYQIHPLSRVSSHARGANLDGVGIALNVDGRVARPSREMWANAVDAVAMLLQKYPDAVVEPHDKYAVNGWDCPGKFIDVERLAAEARERPVEGLQ